MVSLLGLCKLYSIYYQRYVENVTQLEHITLNTYIEAVQ